MKNSKLMKSIDQERFDTLAEYPTASWALWSDDFPDEGCIEDDPTAVREFLAGQREQLRPDVVFLGLNASGELKAPLWNFHGVGRNGLGGGKDRYLKEFIQDAELSQLSGGYMTDLSSDEDPESKNVTVTADDYERFAEQLRLLGGDRHTVIAFGNDAFNALADHIGATEDSDAISLRTFRDDFAGRELEVYRVYHYSYRWGGDIIDKLRAQLAYIAGVRTGKR